MTREEFNSTSFGKGDRFYYQRGIYDIISVSFSEGLFGIDDYDDIDSLSWVRCESGDFSPLDEINRERL